jgi:hypothetical protein
MTAMSSKRLLSAGHCSVCIPETPIVFLTGVTNGRVFAFCARCGVAWADPPSRFLGGKFGRAEVLSGGKARAATEKEIDEHGWFLEIEGTVPGSVMAEETFYVKATPATPRARGRGRGRPAR